MGDHSGWGPEGWRSGVRAEGKVFPHGADRACFTRVASCVKKEEFKTKTGTEWMKMPTALPLTKFWYMEISNNLTGPQSRRAEEKGICLTL